MGSREAILEASVVPVLRRLRTGTSKSSMRCFRRTRSPSTRAARGCMGCMQPRLWLHACAELLRIWLVDATSGAARRLRCGVATGVLPWASRSA